MIGILSTRLNRRPYGYAARLAVAAAAGRSSALAGLGARRHADAHGVERADGVEARPRRQATRRGERGDVCARHIRNR